MKDSKFYTVCPFCNTVHQRTNLYLNVICACGGKYYPCSGDWINRRTGEKAKGLANNKCDCKACPQHQINQAETGFKCNSYGFTVCILKSILDYADSLTVSQRNSIRTTINTLKELDKTKF